MKLLLAQLIDPKNNVPQVDAGQGSLQTVLTIIFTFLGAFAFLMIVVAGLRYILAGSDSNKVSEAKTQMVHALVGLIVAASAAVFVRFVLDRAG